LRRAEIWLVVATAVVLVLAALAGQREAPSEGWADRRPSTYLAGPHGAKGLAQALRRLGVQVRQRRRPAFDLARYQAPALQAEVYAFLDIFVPPDQEIAAVRALVANGGRIFVAGYTGIERCFGYVSRYIGKDALEELEKPLELEPPEPGLVLPGVRRVLERLPAESLRAREDASPDEGGACPLLSPVERRPLLLATDKRLAAVALRFRGGGRAVLVAEPTFVSNRSLKETDAGLLVIPWLLEDGVRRVVVDEFHLGFGSGRTVWDLARAAGGWLVAQPGGWVVLQLVLVGIVALFVTSARFGPVLVGVERRRRSPLEHLEALATGLEGASGGDTAVELIVGGLRRRLRKSGQLPAHDAREWLGALDLALSSDRGRQAARRLKWIISQRGGDDRVLAAAQAAEDVWEELHRRRTRD